MNRRVLLSKRESLVQSKAGLDFYAQAAGVSAPVFLTTMKPVVPRSKKPTDRPLERQVLKEVLERLRQSDKVAFAWRMQSGLFEQGNRVIRVGVMGMPDVIFLLRGGRFGGCEVKRPREFLTPVQQYRLDHINNNGGLAFVARCAADVDAALQRGTP